MTPMLRIALVVLLATTAAHAATHAATLRGQSTLSGPLVRLSDLWDGTGDAGARVLGPSPPPGGRITVGTAQLGAIARADGIDWAPSGGEQAVLDRPGAPLPLAAVLAVLRPALAAQGLVGQNDSYDIALPFYEPPMLDAGAAPRLGVGALSLDQATGRFTATLAVQAGPQAGGTTLALRLAGSVVRTVAVLLPTHRLLPGSVLAPADFAPGQVRDGSIAQAVVRDPSQVAGMVLRHLAVPGQPVPVADLVPPLAVAKGSRVLIGLAIPGLDVGAIGIAMADGAAGDAVAVRNPASGAILSATVTGAGQVRVDPGTPVRTAAASPFTLAVR